MPNRRPRDPALPVKRHITFGLIVAGAVAGAVICIVLTVAGKVVAGAPPATLANYRWNAIAFAAMGACVTPLVTWSALRRVPLWRAVAEPLLGGVVGGRYRVHYEAARLSGLGKRRPEELTQGRRLVGAGALH